MTAAARVAAAPPAVTAVAAMARTYVHAGWKVFPLWWIDPDTGRCACPDGQRPLDDPKACVGSQGKHPLIKRGVNAASDNLGQVAKWWDRSPHAGIGIPAHGNDLAIIDVDPYHGGDRSLQRLRTRLSDHGYLWPGGHAGPGETLTQVTGSGGRHYLFTAPDGGIKNVAKAFGPDLPGLDTRGRGGYIVGAPTAHVTGGVYEWLNFFADAVPWPRQLTELMESPKIAPPSVMIDAQIPESFNNVERYVAVAVTVELEALRSARKDGRNNQLNKAGYAIGRFVAAGQLDERVAYAELVAAGRACGLDEKEIPKSALSGLAAGKGRATGDVGGRR